MERLPYDGPEAIAYPLVDSVGASNDLDNAFLRPWGDWFIILPARQHFAAGHFLVQSDMWNFMFALQGGDIFYEAIDGMENTLQYKVFWLIAQLKCMLYLSAPMCWNCVFF